MRNRRRQWIRKIRVLSLSELIACHHDSGSKSTIVIVQRSQGPARRSVEHPRHVGVSVRHNRLFDGRPIQSVEIRKPLSVRGHGDSSMMRAMPRRRHVAWSPPPCPSNDNLKHSASKMSTARGGGARGEWRVERGEGRVESGEGRVESGERRVESEEWGVKSGE